MDITSEYSTCNLTSDNFNGGEQLALYVTNKLGGKGNILALDTPGWHSLEIRLRMLDAVIMDYPDLNVVQTISIGTQDAVNNYYKEVKSYLQGNSDIDAIYCSWGLAAVGASQAVRELGLQDQIFVVCRPGRAGGNAAGGLSADRGSGPVPRPAWFRGGGDGRQCCEREPGARRGICPHHSDREDRSQRMVLRARHYDG